MDISFLKAGRRFRTLIDIGANDGAYGAYLRDLFDIPRAIAFEPLPAHQETLAGRAFEVHPVALDRQPGRASFIVNRYDAASSLYPLTAATAAEWPEASEVATITVEKRRLDDCVGEIEPELLIKVDAQGAETEIIEGGQETFTRASAILIETCFVPLYEGQGLFNEIHARLMPFGFRLAGFKHQHIGRDGRPMFAHAIYEK